MKKGAQMAVLTRVSLFDGHGRAIGTAFVAPADPAPDVLLWGLRAFIRQGWRAGEIAGEVRTGAIYIDASQVTAIGFEPVAGVAGADQPVARADDGMDRVPPSSVAPPVTTS
jgi:hypothetical protein